MQRTISEALLDGPVPRAEIPGWREKYGVVAGITRKPYDLGLWTTDPVEQVMTRWREFRRHEPGFSLYVLGNQVHGARVEIHLPPSTASRRRPRKSQVKRLSQLQVQTPATEWRVLDGVDGHVAAERGTMLCVTVADCTPVYLLHPSTGAVALLHAGWRGTAAGILERGVQSLLVAATGIPGDPAEAGIVCHLGVSICRDCYEVGPEVFEAVGYPRPEGPEGKGCLDVRGVLADQAEALGIKELSISSHCSRHGEAWYSHRGGDGGRMVAYLGAV
ncbi:MAG TPA: laccase domain-containing protein [Gemmatimonadales bacterium]|nr:laccase domain-containing protein [Gemmatimonadales bacterium]